MSFDLMAKPELLDFDFNGVKVVLKKYIDAGVHEDLENEASRVRFIQTAKGEAAREVNMNGGGRLKMLQHMLVSVTEPDGTTHYQPFGEDFVAKFSREAYMILTDAIDEHNAPLAELRAQRLMENREIEAGLITRLQPNENSSNEYPSSAPIEPQVASYDPGVGLLDG